MERETRLYLFVAVLIIIGAIVLYKFLKSNQNATKEDTVKGTLSVLNIIQLIAAIICIVLGMKYLFS
jgi:putative Mn2+ efflux pump MntP